MNDKLDDFMRREVPLPAQGNDSADKLWRRLTPLRPHWQKWAIPILVTASVVTVIQVRSTRMQADATWAVESLAWDDLANDVILEGEELLALTEE